MEKKTLGSFLSALRRAQGLTQQEVADRLAVSNKAVSRWERDEAMPDILLLPAIADLFGVTVDELLRGERMREATLRESAPTSTSSDTTENSNEPQAEPSTDGGYAHEPPPDPRALRGLRALMKRAIAQIRNFGILSFALSYAGLMVMLGISYGFYRPVLGYALQMLFGLGGLSVLWFASFHMRDQLNELIFDTTDTRLPVIELARGCYHYAYWVWLVYAAAAHAFVLGSVLCLKSGSHSVLIQSHYAVLVLIITLVYIIIHACVKPYAIRHLCRPWAPICGETINTWTPVPHNLRAQVSLTLWQIIPAVLGTVGCMVANYGLDHPEGQIDYAAIAGVSLLAVCLAVSVVSLPLRLRKLPKGSLLRRDTLIVGIRNLILNAVFLLTANASFVYIRATSPDGRVEISYYWNEGVLLVGIAMILAAILITEVVRQRVQRKKA